MYSILVKQVMRIKNLELRTQKVIRIKVIRIRNGLDIQMWTRLRCPSISSRTMNTTTSSC